MAAMPAIARGGSEDSPRWVVQDNDLGGCGIHPGGVYRWGRLAGRGELCTTAYSVVLSQDGHRHGVWEFFGFGSGLGSG